MVGVESRMVKTSAPEASGALTTGPSTVTTGTFGTQLNTLTLSRYHPLRVEHWSIPRSHCSRTLIPGGAKFPRSTCVRPHDPPIEPTLVPLQAGCPASGLV